MRVRHRTVDLRVAGVLAAAVSVAVVLTVLALRPASPPSVDSSATAPREQVGPEREAAVGRYVALGDWWAAGPGPARDTSSAEDRSCRRSRWSYPELVAGRLGLQLSQRACAGAAPDTVGLGGRAPDGREVPAQIQGLSDLTDLVTLSVGAEGTGMLARTTSACLRLAARSPSGSPCRDAFGAAGLGTVRAGAGAVAEEIGTLLQEIVRRAPRARVVVVGYVDFFDTRSGCFARSGVADGDLAYLSEAMDVLLEAVRGTAVASGVEYVDPGGLFAGHLVCSREPYVVRDRSVGGPGFALTRAGHQAIASALVRTAAGQRQ